MKVLRSVAVAVVFAAADCLADCSAEGRVEEAKESCILCLRPREIRNLRGS